MHCAFFVQLPLKYLPFLLLLLLHLSVVITHTFILVRIDEGFIVFDLLVVEASIYSDIILTFPAKFLALQENLFFFLSCCRKMVNAPDNECT